MPSFNAFGDVLLYSEADMIFVKKFMRPQFWKQEFYAKKRGNRDESQFATKERKFLKIA